jgi:hypothetical protein
MVAGTMIEVNNCWFRAFQVLPLLGGGTKVAICAYLTAWLLVRLVRATIGMLRELVELRIAWFLASELRNKPSRARRAPCHPMARS